MNPYSPSEPVRDPKMFYGYQSDVIKIVDKVTALQQARRSYLIVGGNRIGKTSLLLQIERQLIEANIYNAADSFYQIVIPIYLDMITVSPYPQNFFGYVADALNTSLDAVWIPNIPVSVKRSLQLMKSTKRPFEVFIKGLHELIEALSPAGLRVVLLIDNLWRHHQETYVLCADLHALYGQQQLGHSMAYVITCSYRDLRKALSPWSPLESILMYYPLHVFSEEQSLALITSPTGGKISAEVSRQIYAETGGHPLLLQYLMSVLCEYNDLAELTVEHVTHALKGFRKEQRIFEHWWEDLDAITKQVYEIVCEQGKVSSSVNSSLFPKISISKPADIKAIQDSLRVLSTTGLIRECGDDFYEIAGIWPARNLVFRSLQQDKCPVTMFYSYASEDEAYAIKLQKHLIDLQRNGYISEYFSGNPELGTEADTAIRKHIKTAQIILLFISEDFIYSKHSSNQGNVELDLAMERSKEGARVIPIYLRHIDQWKVRPFGKLAALPRNGQPVAEVENTDAAFAELAGEIRRVIIEKIGGNSASL